MRLTQYLLDVFESELSEHGFEMGSPKDDSKRADPIILEHQEYARICKALNQEDHS
ncbi:hypothetical protein SRABI96_02078 [Peribacillus sp. Bi96]|uniref:kynureninase/PvdN C-terminal domain-containing protein n=1 Tax=Peribacillus sp. Bi96 TaxID=2884273 RepID=UPI001DDDAD38|nr:hypothetical protein [Peribacillus sp. Bi96]CAH0207181.1 hypothetical protein SRABI96_02078 [Peribacillus sp. Bi96]